MTTKMQRNKALLIAILTATAATAAFVVAGTAFGQDWYEYNGRLTAGNAYLVTVPEGAEALELELVSTGDAAAATVAFFDPADKKEAVWKLDSDVSKATLASPVAGDHVLFVYSLTDSGLVLRTSAAAADEDLLKIKRVGTERHDLRITSVDKPAALSQKFTAPAIHREPVFATLLYSGSAEGLSATVVSEKGTVLEVVNEDGTAYGPGLYGTVSGERNIFPENLSPGSYTATASATRFEGDLFLTFVTYTRGKIHAIPDPKVETPDTPVAPEAAEVYPGVPTAVMVPPGAGALVFSLPVEDEEEEEGDEMRGPGRPPAPPRPRAWSGHYSCPEAISVYTPDDRLLGVATFDEETMTATLPVDGAGEYVVVVHGGYRDMPVLLALADLEMVPAVRELDVVVEELDLGKADLFGNVESAFTLERAPLMLAWRMQGVQSFALFADGLFTSEAGEAVHQNSMVSSEWSRWSDYGMVTYENLMEGDYTFALNGALSHGKVAGLAVFYDRATEIVEDEDA